jgi:hypothetical protein
MSISVFFTIVFIFRFCEGRKYKNTGNNKILNNVLIKKEDFRDSGGYCQRSWPQLTLYMSVRTFSNMSDVRFHEHQNIFLRTLLFFWPLKLSNTSLLFQCDSETVNDGHFIPHLKRTVSALKKRIPGGVNLIDVPKYPFYTAGYDRQQYNMFWADNFTSSEFIGFVDADTAFVTYVDREDLWENGKPVVNCVTGPIQHDKSARGFWAEGTFRSLKVKEPFTCMSYFPVILKSSHLKELREHMVKLHNKETFGQVFKDVVLKEGVAQSYSQYCIMMTYLWFHFRKDYVWLDCIDLL